MPRWRTGTVEAIDRSSAWGHQDPVARSPALHRKDREERSVLTREEDTGTALVPVACLVVAADSGQVRSRGPTANPSLASPDA